MCVTRTSNGMRAGRLVAAALVALAASPLLASSPVATAQTVAQALPPGFHSFVPRSDDQKYVRVLSEQARADLDSGVAAYMAKDYGAAYTLLALPAQEGDIKANWMLAFMYGKGLGGPVDQAAAFRIYEDMAAKYDPEEPDRSTRYFMVDGLSRLADELRTGNESAGITRDRRRALRLYQMAASAGHANAQYGLGTMYLFGEGVAKDRSYAMRWLGTAAQKRHAGAAAILGDLYSESGNPVLALVWYRISADTADSELSPRVLERHENISKSLDQNQLAKADKLYDRWNRRFPAQHQTAN